MGIAENTFKSINSNTHSEVLLKNSFVITRQFPKYFECRLVFKYLQSLF